MKTGSISVEDFFAGDEMKIDVFRSKYLRDQSESVTDCFNRIAHEIANVSIETSPDVWKEIWAKENLKDEWRCGGSIIAATNKKEKKISTANCTTIPLLGDSLEAIYKCRYQVAKCGAYRQGIGVDFSVLRPNGTTINNSSEVSQGVVHWVRSFNSTADEVGQKGRRVALLGSLKVHHPDIEEFIICKDDCKSIQNMNLSVQITDEFMKAVFVDGDFELRFTMDSGQVISKIVKAKELFNKICDHAWASGDPGWQAIDLMNEYSIQKALGYNLISTNACSEKPLPPYSTCNLASINMGNVPPIDSPDFKSYLESKTRSIVRHQDNVIQYEIDNSYKCPLPEQLEIIKNLREIGLGVTNIHMWLYKQGMEYDSDEGISAIEEFYRWYSYYAFKASCDLAIERGPCPAWTKIFDEEGIRGLMKRETKYLRHMFDEFPELASTYYSRGIRNAALLSQAPTGSISLTFSGDCISSGIEPIIMPYYWRRTRAVSKGEWDYYFVIPTFVLKTALDNMEDKFSDDYVFLSNISGSVLDNDGKIGERAVKVLDQYVNMNLFKGAYEIDPYKKLDMICRVQKYVDAAISVTFNVPNSFTKEQVRELYLRGYENGLKAMTVFREGSKEGIMFKEFPKTHKKAEFTGCSRPDNVEYVFAPKRPKKLPCDVYKVLKHAVVVGLLNEKPYEMFILDVDKKFPDSGFIQKNGKRKYQLLDETGAVIVDNMIDIEIANEEIQAITRLTSSNLRHGVPIDFICDQLSKCGNSISSYPKMLGRVLKKYKFLVMESVTTSERCPECGELLIRNSGCLNCVNCTYSKCS